MSEETDIEIIPQDEEVTKAVRQMGLKTLGLGMMIAALLGAGGGAVLSKAFQKPAVNISALTTTLEVLKSENKTLKAQVARLQRDIKALPKPAAIDLSSIETRLGVLEGAKPQVIDQDLLARLEALNEEGSEALDLSDILSRLEALETRPVPTAPVATVSVQSPNSVSEPFPKTAVLAAIEASEPSGGWLQRSLKKHISVQSDDNPRYLVELIVQNIKDKNIEAALAAFDKLPAEAKAAGQDWRESATQNSESQ